MSSRKTSLCLSVAAGALLLIAAQAQAQTNAPSYLMADGSSTRHYDEALESWRTHLPFKADYAKAYLGLEHAYARGLSGRGVGLAINDSGLYWDHPLFGGQEAGLETGTSDDLGNLGHISALEPWQSHGTHVAGTAAGHRLEGGLMFGAAYGADLYGATAHFADRNISYGPAFFAADRLATGIDNLINIAASGQARIINNSWGVPQSRLRFDASLSDIDAFFASSRDQITQTAWDQVIAHDSLVVMSAGNDAASHASQWNLAPRYVPGLNGHFVTVTNYGADDLHNGSNLCGATATWCVAGPGQDILSATTDFSFDSSGWYAAYDYMDLIRDEVFFDDYAERGLVPAIEAHQARKIDAFITARLAAQSNNQAFDTAAELTRLGQDLSDFSKTLLSLLNNAKPNIGFDVASLTSRLHERLGQGLTSDEAGLIAQAYKDDLLPALHEHMGEVTPAYAYASGTSMAAPNVSGFAALLIEAFPDYGSPLISDILLSSGRDIGEAGVDIAAGWGVPQMEAALEGPSALRAVREVRVSAGQQHRWTHNITDAADRYSPVVLERNPDDIGGLIKLGGGELILSGTSPYSGETRIREGLLTLEGELTRSALTVEGLGMVRGTGQMASLNAEAGGVVAPGDHANPFGRLRVSGDARLAPGSYLWVRTSADAQQHSRLEVKGAAQIDGGQVIVKADTGSWSLRRRGLNILTADGGVTGTFDGVTSDLGFLTPSLSYHDRSVQLQLVRNDVAIASAGTTANGRAVGAALDAMTAQNLTGDLTLEDAILDGSFDGVAAALPSLTGDIHPVLIGTTSLSAKQFRDTLVERGLDLPGAANSLSTQPGQGLTLWATSLMGSGTFNGNDDYSPYDQSSAGFAAGLDKAIGPSTLIGAAISQTKTEVEVDGITASGDATTTQAGLYAHHRIKALSLSTGGSWISTKADTRRTVAFNTFNNRLISDYQAEGWQLWARASVALSAGSTKLEPYLGYSRYEIDGEMVETGADAALQGQIGHSANLATLGLHSQTPLRGPGLKLVGHLAYSQDLSDQAPHLHARFADSPQFDITGLQSLDKAVTTAIGIEVTPRENLRLNLGYIGLHQSDYSDHQLMARASLRF